MKKITLEIDDEIYARLETLTHGEFAPASVEGVIQELIDHAQQGVYRPGAWERGWLCQAFGEDFIEALERDPALPCFRPAQALKGGSP